MSVLQKAAELGMVVSCMGLPRDYVSAAFSDMVEAAPDVPFMIEHLGYVKHDDPSSHKAFEELLGLARYSNVFMKVPGLGELMSRPMPLTHPPSLRPFQGASVHRHGVRRLRG
jgi:predicted TIM-barrel fold metal-dependent hydrolase